MIGVIAAGIVVVLAAGLAARANGLLVRPRPAGEVAHQVPDAPRPRLGYLR